MTTLATALSAELQALVDARLDTIDRMLMGRMSRADRLAIVEEVSGQIEEMLARKDRENLDREDVLEVLSRLDPPEAYLAEDIEPVSVVKKTGYVTDSPAKLGPRSSGDTRTRWTGVIFGLVAPLLVFLVAPAGLVVASATNSHLIFFVLCALPGLVAFLSSLVAIILEILNPAKKAWNIVALTLAALSLPMALLIGAYSVLILANM